MTAQELLDGIRRAVADGTIQFEPLAPAEMNQGPYDLIPAEYESAVFYDGSSVIERDGKQVVNVALVLTPSAGEPEVATLKLCNSLPRSRTSSNSPTTRKTPSWYSTPSRTSDLNTTSASTLMVRTPSSSSSSSW